MDYWKGFCVRTFDFTELTIENIDDSTLNEIERQYIAWPAVLRTSIHLAQTFLRRVCNSTGLQMINTSDVAVISRHMQAAEIAIATRMEELLFERVLQETTAFNLMVNGKN